MNDVDMNDSYMNDIDLLARLRADVPEAGADVITQARVQLMDRMTPPVAAPPRRRRVGRRLAVVAGVAAAVAAAAVTANVVTVHHKPLGGATADAAALLSQAADAAARSADPPLQPGQYRYVRTHSWDANLNADDGHTYLGEQLREEWYASAGLEDIRTTGPIATKFFDQAYETQLRAAHPEDFVKKTSLIRGVSADPNPEWVASLPLHDSKALLAKIDPFVDTSSRESKYAGEFIWISDFLRSGLVDGAVRAAVYRAAATIPGVYLVDRTANLDGQRGVAIGRNSGDGTLRTEFLFDAPAGRYIGAREVLLRPNCMEVDNHKQVCSDVPVGSILDSTAVTMKVVTSRPTH
jgi:hypothetical protein